MIFFYSKSGDRILVENECTTKGGVPLGTLCFSAYSPDFDNATPYANFSKKPLFKQFSNGFLIFR
jgi:hypothetical protein